MLSHYVLADGPASIAPNGGEKTFEMRPPGPFRAERITVHVRGRAFELPWWLRRALRAVSHFLHFTLGGWRVSPLAWFARLLSYWARSEQEKLQTGLLVQSVRVGNRDQLVGSAPAAIFVHGVRMDFETATEQSSIKVVVENGGPQPRDVAIAMVGIMDDGRPPPPFDPADLDFDDEDEFDDDDDE